MAQTDPSSATSYRSSVFSRQFPRWRLIPFLQASGATQMAIDRWLLAKHLEGEQPPSLRFYTWHPGAISLGYHQRDYPLAWQKLTWQGKPLDIVRRPTGGRAVLHQGDLTYGVVTSTLPGKRLATYKQICQFLIDGWRSLGVELDYGSARAEYMQSHNCFATATGADLIVKSGDKAIGSAQLRKGKVILQHGSMMLTTDRQLFKQIFGDSDRSNLLDFIPPESNIPSTEQIIAALIQAAISCFKIDLAIEPLSDAEWEDITTNFLL